MSRHGIDATRPSPARMYDYFLGGHNNYEVDRKAAEAVINAAPEVRDAARANREFLGNAVRYAAQQHGIRQFLDIGSGLPTQENVHQIAQQVQPNARTLYVDNDPSVLPQAAAIILGDPNTAYIEADITDPADLIRQAESAGVLDFTQPVAVLMVALLHFVADGDGAYDVVATLLDRVAPGSLLILSHVSGDDMEPRVWQTLQDNNARLTKPVTYRTRAQVERFFTGLTIQPPGLVHIRQWRPGPTPLDAPMLRVDGWCGVGVKP